MDEVVGIGELLSDVTDSCSGSERVGDASGSVGLPSGIPARAGSKEGTRRLVSCGRRSRLMAGVGRGDSTAIDAEAPSECAR